MVLVVTCPCNLDPEPCLYLLLAPSRLMHYELDFQAT
jgi:hypothetical protein